MAYSAYGVEYELARGPGGPTREKFTGKEFDRDGMYDDGQGTTTTGINLQYFGFRYYDPEVGIWTSGDPVDEFWNSYSYVGGNPVNFIDHWGLNSDPPYDPEKATTIVFMKGSEIKGKYYDGPDTHSDPNLNMTEKELKKAIKQYEKLQEELRRQARFLSFSKKMAEKRAEWRAKNPHIHLDPTHTEYGKGTGKEKTVTFPFDLSRNTGDYNNPMHNSKAFIIISQDMNMDKVAYDFRNAILTELAVIGGSAGTYYWGPTIFTRGIKPTAQLIWQHRVTIEKIVNKSIKTVGPKIPVPGTPFKLSTSLPGTAATTLRVGVPILIEGFLDFMESEDSPETDPFAPDATRVYP